MYLTGILTTYKPDRNGRIYSTKVSDKAFKDYIQKFIISQRKEKIKNIMVKINNNNI